MRIIIFELEDTLKITELHCRSVIGILIASYLFTKRYQAHRPTMQWLIPVANCRFFKPFLMLRWDHSWIDLELIDPSFTLGGKTFRASPLPYQTDLLVFKDCCQWTTLLPAPESSPGKKVPVPSYGFWTILWYHILSLLLQKRLGQYKLRETGICSPGALKPSTPGSMLSGGGILKASQTSLPLACSLIPFPHPGFPF